MQFWSYHVSGAERLFANGLFSALLLTAAFFSEQQIRLPSGREIRCAVSCVEERGPLFGRQVGVRADGEGFVMAEIAANNNNLTLAISRLHKL